MSNLLKTEGYKLLHNRSFWSKVVLVSLFSAATNSINQFDWGDPQLMTFFVSPMVTIGLFGVAGCYLFQRKEIR